MKQRSMVITLAIILVLSTAPIGIAQSTGYWELVDTEAVVPDDYTVGDQTDTRVTKVSYSEGSATITYTRTVYDGIKKVYLNEALVVKGGWSKPPTKVEPGDVVTLDLSASIDRFERVSINNSGVQVKAYFADLNAPFGRLNASAGDLVDNSGKAVCEAWINDGVIKTASQTKAVSGTFGAGSAGARKALFVVVRGDKLTGAKYIYEWKAGEAPPAPPAAEDPPALEEPTTLPEETGQKFVYGTVYFDREMTKPVPYAAATLLYVDSGGRIVGDSGIVYPLDAKGSYRIPVDRPVPEGGSVRLSVELVYLRDGVLSMQLIDYRTSHAGGFRIGSVQPVAIGDEPEILFDFCPLDGFQVLNVQLPTEPETIEIGQNMALFERMVFAYQFYRDDRSVDMDHKLPLKVNAFYYDFDDPDPDRDFAYLLFNDGDIYLSDIYSNFDEDEAEFVFFHEFSHYAMACMYNGLPDLPAGDRNHGGYANRSTADSFQEGFATFMGMMLYRDWNDSERTLVPMRSDLELNWKAWERSGQAEEYAVAGAMLDLIDKPARDDDRISLGFGNLWGMLEMPTTTVADFYANLTAAFEGQKEAIDAVFRDHGLHGANRGGDGVYNSGEAFLDVDGSGSWESGERFVDYSLNEAGKIPRMEYVDGDRIGTTSYFSDPARRTTEAFPGCFIKVDNEIPYYVVSVAFFDDSSMDYTTRTRNDNGHVYVEVPPDAYDCEITILPDGIPDAAPLVFSSWEFQSAYGDALANGYFLANAFDENGDGAGYALTAAGPETEEATGKGLLPPVAIAIALLLLIGGTVALQRKRRA